MQKLLENVEITNFDYEKLLTADGENVFLYLDSPYFSAPKSMLYRNRGNLHKNFDYERFVEAVKHCKHKWLITLDPCGHIRELFNFAEIQPLQFSYGMRNVKGKSNQTGNELIIKNY